MEGHAHNDMLSPYSNTVLRKSQSKSPRRPDDETKTQDVLENEGLSNKNRELTDYLVNRQSIDYPKLMGDAISKVDELLIKACKKDGQVGGKNNLLSHTVSIHIFLFKNSYLTNCYYLNFVAKIVKYYRILDFKICVSNILIFMPKVSILRLKLHFEP